MKWRTRTSGTRSQIGKKFPLRPKGDKSKLPKALRQIATKSMGIRKINLMLGYKGRPDDLGNPDLWAQRKLDGTRALIVKHGSYVWIYGRSWKNDYAGRYPLIVKAIRNIPARHIILDSELTYFDKKGRDVFLTALATPETRKERKLQPRAMIFDILKLNSKDLKKSPLSKRYEILKSVVKSGKRIKILPYIKRNKEEYFNAITQRRGEGLMLKHKDSPYVGKRSRYWLKYKLMYTEGADTADLVIIGVTHGRGRRKKTFGALILGAYKKGKIVHVTNSSGFTDQEQKDLVKKLKKFKTDKTPLDQDYKWVKYWVKPKLVAEIKYHEKTKDGGLRFPSFERVRTDKRPKECKL